VGWPLDPESRRGEVPDIGSLILPLETDLTGTLVRRYKRFLADIETPDGEVVTVHCPNPGRMLGCSRPGASVRCSTSSNPKRKLRHTLEMIRVGRSWVGVQPMHANRIARLALEAGAIEPLRGYREIQSEVEVPGGSRLDFRLSFNPRDSRPAFVEVKSVTMEDSGVALFPDAVTSRGKRHMETLATLHREGARAAVLFIVQRVDCDSMAPADAIDPEYGEALRQAVRHGVEAVAIRVRVTARGIHLERQIPVLL
jgi:sugar fermentation stimulation protein A